MKNYVYINELGDPNVVAYEEGMEQPGRDYLTGKERENVLTEMRMEVGEIVTDEAPSDDITVMAGKYKGLTTMQATLARQGNFGFVNLHTNDSENGRGDRKWYEFDSNRTRHQGEPLLTRSEAIEQGYAIG